MLRLLCIGILLLAVNGCGTEEPAWTAQALGTDAEFHDIAFLDEQNGWIVGGQYGIDGGVIGNTTDGGRTWRFRSGLVPVPRRLSVVHVYDIHFIDDMNACMAASGGMILRTDDGGNGWRVVRRGTVHARLYDIDFIDNDHGWAVGWDRVLTTDDGGLTWRRLSEKRVYGNAVRFLDENTGYIVGQNGALHRTSDGGETWELVDSLGIEDKPHFSEIEFVDSLYGWIVGENGTILHTSNAGETWVRQDCGVRAFLTSVSFIDSQQGWVVGFTRESGMSYVLHTADGGATWVVQKRIKGEELLAIHMMRGKGWAVGNRSREEPQKILLFSDPRAVNEAMGANLAR
jgi:photosystem II stability/assembly factor-like uncharacterized protein